MLRIYACCFALAFLSAACADPVAPPAPTPVAPTITETFDATLPQLGTNTHAFKVQQIGGVKVNIALAPDSAVSFGVGVQSLVGCTVITTAKHQPGEQTQISGTATTAGDYCVMVFDSDAIAEPVAYTVTVLHS